MTRLVSKENKTKSHWHFHYGKRRLYLLYLSLLFMDRMNYFHSNVCLCSHSVVPFSSISNQNQKSIYFTQKYVHKNMCGPFMTLQFGIPKAFYCLYPADIERYKLSFVSSIKWKIRLKVFISNKMWHLFIYMHPQKCTCIIVEEEIWRKNDDSGFLSSSNISTTFFFSINHLISHPSVRPLQSIFPPAPCWCHFMSESEFQFQYRQNMMDVFFSNGIEPNRGNERPQDEKKNMSPKPEQKPNQWT